MLIIGALDIMETSDDSFQLAETGCFDNRWKWRNRTRHGEAEGGSLRAAPEVSTIRGVNLACAISIGSRRSVTV